MDDGGCKVQGVWQFDSHDGSHPNLSGTLANEGRYRQHMHSRTRKKTLIIRQYRSVSIFERSNQTLCSGKVAQGNRIPRIFCRHQSSYNLRSSKWVLFDQVDDAICIQANYHLCRSRRRRDSSCNRSIACCLSSQFSRVSRRSASTSSALRGMCPRAF